MSSSRELVLFTMHNYKRKIPSIDACEGIFLFFIIMHYKQKSGDYFCTAVDEALGICLFDKNAMQRNRNKYKAILFGNSHSDPKFVRKNTVIPLEDDMDFLGVTVGSKLNSTCVWQKLVAKVVSRKQF